MDLLDTIGLNDEEKMSPQTLTAQARELLYFFLGKDFARSIHSRCRIESLFQIMARTSICRRQMQAGPFFTRSWLVT